MRKVKIYHNGIEPGYMTRIEDADTGEMIEGIFKIDLSISVNGPIQAILHVHQPIVDVIVEAELEEYCVYCGSKKDHTTEPLE